MKKSVLLISLVCVFLTCCIRGFSQGNENTIPNFTNLNDPSVTCYYGTFWDPFESIGIVYDRHTVISSQGTDPNTGNNLPLLPPGENKVIRLGNSQTDSQAEAITYKFKVDYFKSILLLKFAVVFQDPNHSFSQQPRFVVRVTDTSGNLVEDCAEYDVTAAGNIPGFNTYSTNIRWRPWTNVGIDLSSYIGKEVIIQFITYDCSQSGHFGYAYYTASCISNNLNVDSCDGYDITLSAPSNFQSYSWSNGNNTQQSKFSVTAESIDAYCDITSATGCVFRLNAHITSEQGLPTQDTIIYDTICVGNTYEKNFFNLPSQDIKGDFTFLNTLCNINNCSYTTITLLLNVNDKMNVYINENICLGEEYHNYGFDLKDLTIGSHNFQQYLTSVGGCDSIVYLNLNVRPPYDTYIIDTICYGDNYTKNGFNITKPITGNLLDTLYLNSIYGCDSIVMLDLTINAVYDTLLFDTICHGNNYSKNGFNIIEPTPGIHFETLYLNSTLGCDSTVTIKLIVGEIHNTHITDSICNGDDYTANGFNIIKPSIGVHLDTLCLNSLYGCDSIVFLNLNIIEKYDDLTIDGLEDVLVSSDLITGYYKYTCNLYDDCYQYNWSISNQEWHIYPNLNECTVLVTSPIKNALTVSAENYCGIFYDTIDLNAEFITFEENNKKDVSAFPNPAKDFINIQYKDIIRINIYNSQGRLVLRQDYNYKNKVHLDLSSLENSIYIMEVITADKTISKRISIIK